MSGQQVTACHARKVTHLVLLQKLEALVDLRKATLLNPKWVALQSRLDQCGKLGVPRLETGMKRAAERASATGWRQRAVVSKEVPVDREVHAELVVGLSKRGVYEIVVRNTNDSAWKRL